MERSVVETGYLCTSPSRSYLTVGVGAPLHWVRRGLQDFMRSPVNAISWGVGFSVTLSMITLLFASSLSAAYIYTAPLVILSIILAAGMCASSRQFEQGTDSDMSAAIAQLWKAKFHLFLLGVSVAILVVMWMRLSSLIHVVSTSSLVPADGSFHEIYLAADGWVTIAAHSVLTLLMTTAIFSLTHLAIPMVVDGDEDIMNAMITSLVVTFKNMAASLVWAVIAIGLLIAGTLAWFPLVALLAPIAFYGSWHGYKSMVATE